MNTAVATQPGSPTLQGGEHHWKMTPRSVTHARPVRVWKGVPASERLRRLEEAAA